jgi:hypothetical protein
MRTLGWTEDDLRNTTTETRNRLIWLLDAQALSEIAAKAEPVAHQSIPSYLTGEHLFEMQNAKRDAALLVESVDIQLGLKEDDDG